MRITWDFKLYSPNLRNKMKSKDLDVVPEQVYNEGKESGVASNAISCVPPLIVLF